MVGNSPKGPWGASDSKPEFTKYLKREELYKRLCAQVSQAARNPESGFEIEVEDDARDIDALAVMYSAHEPADWDRLTSTVDTLVASLRGEAGADSMATITVDRDDAKHTITLTVSQAKGI